MVRVMIPGSRLSGNTQQRVMTGGGSSFLLDGGMGSQNSYRGEEDLIMTTGRDPSLSGQGLGKKMSDKLEKLSIKLPKSKKPKNINFEM